jgi:hypothetical protein
MKVKAITSFVASRYGDIQAGDIFDCDVELALQWRSAGMIEIQQATYSTKVVQEVPSALQNIPLAGGPVSDVSLSPAAPASRKKTPRKSKANTR